MNKSAIKNFAVWSRNRLMNDVKTITGMYGITENGISDPLPVSTWNIQYFDIGTKEPISLTGKEIEKRSTIAGNLRKTAENSDYSTAYNQLIETTASSWFNRLATIRYMEVNGCFDDGLRVLSSSDNGMIDPDLVATPFSSDLSFTNEERQQIITWKYNNQNNELFRFLLFRKCNQLSKSMPGLFEKKNDSSEFLFKPSYIDQDGFIYHLTHDIDEEDWKDQVQITGWLYQYYNTELKDDTYKQIRKDKKKVSKERIPSVTQLFTPHWIVQYMVENSLGRIYINQQLTEGIYADGRGSDEMNEDEISEKRISSEKEIAKQLGWKYFIPEAHQTKEIEEQLENEWNSEKLEPEDLTFFDPSMGSGHILVYAFDVLMQIYRDYGYTDRDAVRSILTHNLYGLDIDERAYQLAYSAVLMTAWKYDKRIFSRGIVPHVYVVEESNDINLDHLKYIGNKLPEQERNNGLKELERLLDDFKDAKIYGSIIRVENYDFDFLKKLLDETDSGIGGIVKDDTLGIEDAIAKIRRIIDLAEVMQRKYMVTVTNPPYMGGSNMNAKLSAYIKKKYPDYKSDLFSVFVVRCTEMTKKEGYAGFLIPYVWMFIQSYEKLRNYIYNSRTIQTLIQFEYSAFEEATVPICTFVLKNSYNKEKGVYFRLTEFKGGMEVQRQKTLEAISNHNCGYYYETCSDNFAKIPGMPVAYWVSQSLLNDFKIGENLKLKGDTRQGMATSDNNRFLKLWFEVNKEKTELHSSNAEEAKKSNKKWFPYNKGGDFRKWYGNESFVINYENDGYEVKENARRLYKSVTRTIKSIGEYFKPCISWSKISSGSIAFRYYPKGFIFDVAGCCIFYEDKEIMNYDFGFLNSKVSKCILQIISPTLNFEAGHVASLPVIRAQKQKNIVSNLALNNISISKTDWDSFETSWDFKRHPLLPDFDNHFTKISDAYNHWSEECDTRFNQLKSNEEELNRIFIDIYGLQDVLTPEEDDSDVTVSKADLTRDIKSLISYAVGCMLGRYSLDKEGLVYAGGDFDSVYWKYKGFAPMNQDGSYPLGSGYTGLGLAEYHYPKFRDDYDPENATTLSFEPDVDNVIPITDEKYLDDDIVQRFCDWISVVYGKDTLEENLAFIAKALGNKDKTSRECIREYFMNDFYKDHCSTYSVTGSGKRPIYWLFDSGKQNAFKALIYMHRWDENTIGRVRIYTHEIQSKYETETKNIEAFIDQSTDHRQIARDEKRLDHLKKQVAEIKDYDEKLEHLASEHIAIDLDDGVKVNYEKVQTDRNGKKFQILSSIK